jgi:AraC-like DNA-binding protein
MPDGDGHGAREAAAPLLGGRAVTVAAALVVDMLGYLERHGTPREEACRMAGIDAATLAGGGGPDVRIPGHQAQRLWPLAVARTGDPLVGLHMAEAFNPGALDIVGYVLLSCRTVHEALDRLARYSGLLNDGLRVDVVHGGREAWCRCTFVTGRDNYLLRDATSAAQVVDAMWGGLARELPALTGTPLVARAVWFRHAPPPTPALRAEYARLLGDPPQLRFDAPEDRFVLAAADLARPIRSANAGLLAAFETHADRALEALSPLLAAGASPGGVGPLGARVSQAIAERLKGAVPPLGEVAGALAMSGRNLQRGLQQEGTSYQQLLDAVRHALAREHLADPAASVGQVGFLLGFSETSAFHRAFRRWTGQAPSAFRAAARAPQPRR